MKKCKTDFSSVIANETMSHGHAQTEDNDVEVGCQTEGRLMTSGTKDAMHRLSTLGIQTRVACKQNVYFEKSRSEV